MESMARAAAPLLLVFAASTLAPLATAQSLMANQVPPTMAQGLFSNWAVGVSAPNPFTGSAGALLVRAPGVAGGLPTSWTPQQFGSATLVHPNYSIAALTANWGAPTGTPPLVPVFGGTSTGGDVTPRVDGNGVLQMTGANWYALNISVGANALGLPGSLIRTRNTASGSAGGDIFSFYPSGSVGIHASFADSVRVEYTREQLGVAAQLDNLDFATGVISVDPQNKVGPIVPVRDRFYFTLASSWLSATPWFTTLGGQPVSASTIYRMTWNGTSWLAPEIAYAHAELFPNRPEGSVEIDALSVYQVPAMGEAPQDRVVFSLTLASNPAGGPAYDQILVYQRPMGPSGSSSSSVACATTALMTITNGIAVRVSDKFGLRQAADGEPDDVDGTCGIDPHRIDPGAPSVFPVLALAEPETPNGAGSLGLAGIRTTLPDPAYTGPIESAPTIETLHLEVTGLDYRGYPLGIVGIFLEGPPTRDGDTPAPPILIGQPILVDPAMVAANAISLSNVVPTPQSGAQPIRVSARIYGVSLSPFAVVELRESWFLSLIY